MSGHSLLIKLLNIISLSIVSKILLRYYFFYFIYVFLLKTYLFTIITDKIILLNRFNIPKHYFFFQCFHYTLFILRHQNPKQLITPFFISIFSLNTSNNICILCRSQFSFVFQSINHDNKIGYRIFQVSFIFRQRKQ